MSVPPACTLPPAPPLHLTHLPLGCPPYKWEPLLPPPTAFITGCDTVHLHRSSAQTAKATAPATWYKISTGDGEMVLETVMMPAHLNTRTQYRKTMHLRNSHSC